MTDSTVSALTAASALDGSELLYAVQGGADRKVTGAQIATYVALTAAAGIVTVDTTVIVGGTTGRVLYDKAGTVGEMTTTGSGTVLALATSPTLVTPVLGVATATSINGNTFTTGTYTLTGTAGKTFTFSNSITIAGTDTTTITFPPASASVGYLNVPQNSRSAAYTTVLADSGKHIFHPGADTSARDFTIDSNGNVPYALGTVLTFVNQHSGGVITIKITSDTMRLAGTGTTGNRTLAADGVATAIKIDTTEWLISGTGLT